MASWTHLSWQPRSLNIKETRGRHLKRYGIVITLHYKFVGLWSRVYLGFCRGGMHIFGWPTPPLITSLSGWGGGMHREGGMHRGRGGDARASCASPLGTPLALILLRGTWAFQSSMAGLLSSFFKGFHELFLTAPILLTGSESEKELPVPYVKCHRRKSFCPLTLIFSQ